MSQLARLTAALTTRPGDPFLLYAIAMEHLKMSQVEQSFTCFSALIESHPNYVPTYFQYGLALAENKQTDQAREILLAGVQVAQKTGDLHAAGEIADALERIE